MYAVLGSALISRFELALTNPLQDPTVPVIPFPKGFRMLAGDPNRKSANPIFVYECHRNPDLTGSLVSKREAVKTGSV
jgi:hypothetical protein